MKRIIFIFFVFVTHIIYAQTSSTLKIFSLSVEGRNDLQGFDSQHPRLSWKIESAQRGVKQTAYQIIVASSNVNLMANRGDVWNSGMIKSDQSLNVIYNGSPLKSCRLYFWKVKVQTNKGSSKWSSSAQWGMGILKPSEWKASWIGLDTFSKNDRPHADYTRLAARYVRKTVSVNKQVSRAMAYISGLGLYELYVNGKKIGNDVLAPTLKEYNKAVPYNSLDITENLKKGLNAFGVILGNGRFFAMRGSKGTKEWITGIPPITNYGYPKLLMQIRIDYNDGSSEIINTNDSWKITDEGPILANNEYDGEEYDANKEIKDWAQPWFNDVSWRKADLVKAPATSIESQLNENITVKDTLKPISIHKTKNGTYILDMGQNMVGWLKISVKGNKGDTVKMVFAETLKSEDSLYLANIRKAKVTDKYIFKANKEIQWEPRFTYHGFRYVEVSGLKYAPSINSFTGKVIYDDISTSGTFKSSNETLNRIFKNAYWTTRGNYRGMPTDCPQRDERMGWLGDRSIESYGESFLFDNSRLYAKWMDDIKDAETEEGSIPDVVPTYWKIYTDNVTWPLSYIIIPEMLRKQFGDTVTYQKNYPYMKKWIYYMWNKYGQNDLVLRDTYGDWCLPPKSPYVIHSTNPAENTKGTLLGSSYFYYGLQLMEQYAQRLGYNSDVQEFERMRKKIHTSFNKLFYNANDMSYANNTVTSNLLPLTFNLAPEKDRKEIFNKITQRTMNMYKGHISTGLIGGQWLMRGLSDNGRSDIAYQIATNTTYPSWGYMAGQGATTIWELWNGNTADPAMNSGNHLMLLGDLLVWYYEYLAGIKTDEEAVAFKQIIMNPIFPKGLEFVEASYTSKYGLIKSNWKRQNRNLDWEISIPANTSATIYLPTADIKKVFENGKKIGNVKEIKFVGNKEGKLVYKIGSGNYHFIISNPE